MEVPGIEPGGRWIGSRDPDHSTPTEARRLTLAGLFLCRDDTIKEAEGGSRLASAHNTHVISAARRFP